MFIILAVKKKEHICSLITIHLALPSLSTDFLLLTHQDSITVIRHGGKTAASVSVLANLKAVTSSVTKGKEEGHLHGVVDGGLSAGDKV